MRRSRGRRHRIPVFLVRLVFAVAAGACAASVALAITPARSAAGGAPGAARLDVDAVDSAAKAAQAVRLRQGLARERISGNEASYDARFYGLDIAFDPSTRTMTGDVRMLAEVVAGPLTRVDLDLASILEVESATCAGNPATFTHVNDLLSIDLDRAYANGETCDLRIRYSGDPQPGGAWAWDTNEGRPMVWTVSEPYLAHTWWPCKDVAADKADSVEVSVTAPTGMTTASNGILAESSDDGIHAIHHWKERHPIATYLVSIASHPYVVDTDYYRPSAADSMAIRFFIFPADTDTARTVNPLIKTMIGIYARLFGEYPFLDEKYGEAQCFFSGGMEHQTCTSLGFWDQGLSAHELSHQWWGDMVTCRDFHHVWLNEGFASYSNALYIENTAGVEAYFRNMAGRAFFGPGTVYVPDDSDPGRIFNGNLSYRKAAWVLHMLRHVLGDDAFFASLRAYGDAYRYSVATTEEFRGICESISGRDLDWFFREWIYGEYYPAYAYDWRTDPAGGGHDVSLTLLQTQSWQIFKMPVDVTIRWEGGEQTFTVLDSLPSQAFVFHVPAAASAVKIDERGWILKTVQEPVVDPPLDRGVLLVNGLAWSLGSEVRSAYDDRAFWGDYPIDFWDLFGEPEGGYPSTLPPPIGRGPIPSDVLGRYRNIIWLGNNVEGDLDAWRNTSIRSYLEAGGNLLLLTKQGDQFLDESLRDYLGVTWAAGGTLYDCVATYAGLSDIGRIGNQTLCSVFDLALTRPDSRVIYKVRQNYDPERGIGAWRRPVGGGTWRPTGGQLVFLSGRPYRWSHPDLRVNTTFILRRFFGEPYLPSAAGEPVAPAALRLSIAGSMPRSRGPVILRVSVPGQTQARIEILDAAGRVVRRLMSGGLDRGVHDIPWDGKDANGRRAPSGIYFARLSSPAGGATARIVSIGQR